jgi:hypothetical protein
LFFFSDYWWLCWQPFEILSFITAYFDRFGLLDGLGQGHFMEHADPNANLKAMTLRAFSFFIFLFLTLLNIIQVEVKIEKKGRVQVDLFRVIIAVNFLYELQTRYEINKSYS